VPTAADALDLSGWPRFAVSVQPAEAARDIETVDDGTIHLDRVGRDELLGATLAVWWLAQYGAGLFVPLRDATAGNETYGGGRYLLDTAKGADLGGAGGAPVLDLNFAYHPSCRYDARWQCALGPDGNRLDVAVRAGERLERVI
jgi:uncharacterized protein (DUF1684 family)